MHDKLYKFILLKKKAEAGHGRGDCSDDWQRSSSQRWGRRGGERELKGGM